MSEVIQIGATWCGPCVKAKADIAKLDPNNFTYLELKEDISLSEFNKVYKPLSGKTSIPQFFYKNANGELSFIGVGYGGKIKQDIIKLLDTDII